MLCRLGAKNQITLPKELLDGLTGKEYFEARREGVTIVLEPVIVRPYETRELSEIRSQIAGGGVEEKDIESLVAEARRVYGS